MEHQLAGISVAGHEYQVRGYVPVTSETFHQEEGDATCFATHLLLPGREIAGFFFYKPQQRLRLLVLAAQYQQTQAGPLVDSQRLGDDVVLSGLTGDEDGLKVMEALHQRARKLEITLKASLLEIVADEEPEPDVAMLNVFAAGLPPIVLMGSSGFSFPLRSGLPAGVLPDWFTQRQSLEWSPGEELNLHTDLPGERSGNALRRFHDSLRHGDPMKELPAEMVLMKLRFVS